MKNSGTVKIAVLGHYGQRNLGDESIIAAAIAGIRRVRPEDRVICISLDPVDSQARHGVESFPLRPGACRTPLRPPTNTASLEEGIRRTSLIDRLRRAAAGVPLLRALYHAPAALAATAGAIVSEAAFLRRNWRALESVEVVVVAGSNQLADNFGGTWGFPYTLLRWGIMARLSGAKFVLVSVGVGPLERWLSKRFVLWVLSSSDYVSVRDPGSARLLQEIGWRRPVSVKPDLAIGYSPTTGCQRSMRAPVPGTGGHSESLTIALNVMPIHDKRYWPYAEQDIQQRYLAAMTAFAKYLMASGHRIVLFGTQPVDEWIAEDLMREVASTALPTDRVGLVRVRELSELEECYGSCDAVVATRFHGILLALRFAKPVVGISYYRKSRELMERFGLGRFALDITTISAAALTRTFETLVKDLAESEEKIRNGIGTLEDELADQYHAVLDQVPDLTPIERNV